MNAAPTDENPDQLPDGPSTTRGGEGWSEEMELAPAHPADRGPETDDADREGERLQ